MNTTQPDRSSYRNGLACAAIVALCLCAARPYAEMGFIDDWSYIRTAQVFARTGHFVYNGWAVEPLGWLVPLGAAFARMFGSTFVSVRLAMLPVAMVAAYLCCRVMEGFGLRPANAVFGTLALMLSPLCLPLEASFMTDVPGLMVLLLCMRMCQRASVASSDGRAMAWLVAAAGANLVGGSVRQIAWLGCLVMVPATAWMLRRQRKIVATGMALFLASLVGVVATLHWFHAQLYSVPEDLLAGPLGGRNVANLVVQVVRFKLCFCLLAMPLLLAWLGPAWRLGKIRMAYVWLWTAVAALFFWALPTSGPASTWRLPFTSHVLESMGLAQPVVPEMLGQRVLVLGQTARTVLAVVVVFCALCLLEWLLNSPAAERLRSPQWRQLRWVLGPYTLAYCVLLLPRGLTSIVFDRYWMGLLPVAFVVLLRLHQELVAPRMPVASYAALLLYAGFAICGTHDWFALDRARVAAAREVMAAGVPRTAIEGGFDLDGTTEIEAAGYLNDYRLPQYRPVPQTPNLPAACQNWFRKETPAIVPQYFVVGPGLDCLTQSRFAAVEYRTWLPPFHRRVEVRQLPYLAIR